MGRLWRGRAARARWTSCLLIACAIAAITAVGLSTDTLGGFQARAADTIFPRGHQDPNVAVVGIDATSIAKIGPWPWPRSVQAALVDRLVGQGARVVALDFVYSPASTGDDQLAAALRRAHAVVSESVDLAQPTADDLYRVRVAVPPVPVIAGAATVGHAAVTPDPSDGIVRTLPLVVEQDRHFVPAFSLVVLASAGGMSAVPTVRPGAVQVGNRLIPTTTEHELRISYTAGTTDSSVPPISAAAVLAGHVDRSRIRDKVVFVGVTDLSVGDRVLTPVDGGRGLPGVLVHANAYDTVATHRFLATTSDSSVVLWTLLLALAIAVAIQFTPLWLASLLAALVGAGYVAYAFDRANDGLVMNFIYPPAAILLAIPAALGVRYLLETRHRRYITRIFEQYVPATVAQQLVDTQHPETLMDGVSVYATILFCDIRGFTALTAGLDPRQVRALLDCYYEALSRVILDHHGTVLRYVGDEVYAVFGAPLALENHETTAVECARAIHATRAALNETLALVGIPSIDYGIGVNSGDLVSAVVGSSVRRQYAVIGNSVNLGARLCAQADVGEIVISQTTFDALGDHSDEWHPYAATLKGFATPQTAYRSTTPSTQPTVAEPVGDGTRP